jgi:hypothetical protein
MKIARVVFLVFFFFLFTVVPDSGADELSDLKKAVEEQERELQELRKKVEELEKKRLEEEEAEKKIDVREHEELKKKVEELEERRRMEEEAAKEMEELLPKFGVNLGLFADINFSSESREKRADTFSLGNAALYSTAGYGERLNFLFELIIEFEEDNDVEVDMERLWAGYTINDLLIVRAGKFHTPVGYWNKAFHHGKHLFPTVERPFFIRFEDDEGIVPVHLIGLEFSGSADIGPARAKYWLMVGNEPEIVNGKLEPNNTTDDDSSKAVAFRVALTPKRLPGLSVGLFYTHFPVETTLKPGLDENIYGLDVRYERAGLEFLGEYYFFDNSVASANAFYAQLSKDLGRFTPYTRFEWLNVDSDDPYMSDLNGAFDRSQFIGGLRFDIDLLHSSLKAQYRHDDDRGTADDDFDIFEAQWTFHF